MATLAPIGTIGTWIDSKTGLGYSGPKKNLNDIPSSESATPIVPVKSPSNMSPSASSASTQMPPAVQRNLALSNDNEALSLTGNTSANSAAQKFALALQKMLIQYQQPIFQQGQANITDLTRAGLDLSSQQALRTAYTPPSLMGASPGLQAQARGASAEALSPSISATGQRIQGINEQMANMSNMFSNAQNMAQVYMNIEDREMAAKKESVAIYFAMLEKNPEEFKKFIQGLKATDPKKAKTILDTMGISEEALEFFKGTPSEIKAPETKNFGTSDNPIWKQWNSSTGAWENISGVEPTEKEENSFYDESDLAMINNLLKSDSGINSAVGTTFLGRIGVGEQLTGKRQDFIAGVENLVKTMTLENFIEAKKQGATFGAMSEGEWKILADSASKISSWRKFDKNGNVTGYNANPLSFRAELERIKGLIEKAVIPATQNQIQNQMLGGVSSPIYAGSSSSGTGNSYQSSLGNTYYIYK